MRKFAFLVFVLITSLAAPAGKAQSRETDGKRRVVPSVSDSSTVRSAQRDLASAPAPRASGAYGELPLSFEENRGQTDTRVNYLARGKGYTMFLTPNEAVLSLRHELPTAKDDSKASSILRLRGREESKWSQDVVRFELAGASANPKMEAQEALPGVSNYYIGNDPAKWLTGVPNFRKVIYRSAYPGIDVTYYGNPGVLESDFVVAPGADPSVIEWNVTGVKKMRVDESGDLILETAGESLRLQKPVVYQMLAGVRTEVAGEYLIERDKVHFTIGAYDRTQALVIDPTLSYSTYLGGSGTNAGDVARGIAVDTAGEAYVAGSTSSTDFPTTSAFQDTLVQGAFQNAFVSKFSADGSSLVFSTYLGGNFNDQANGIAVDTAGNAYVVGSTVSSEFPLHLPLTGQSEFTGNGCGFVSAFSPAGALTFSTFLCGGSQDVANQVAVDANKNIFVVGNTSSSGFPTANPVQANLAGSQNAFVTELRAINGNGSAILFSTFFGGNNTDSGNGIAVDANANIYIAGGTNSNVFPTKNAIQTTLNAKSEGLNAFAAEIAIADVPVTVYSTYFGGSNSDFANAVAADTAGNTYFAGSATSPDFPLKNSLQAPDQTGDAFVAKIGPGGAPLDFSTLFGGSGFSQPTTAQAIALDSANDVYIAGSTSSADFPTRIPVQATLNDEFGQIVGFVTELKPDGSDFIFSTFFGGSSNTSENGDVVNGIAIDGNKNIYIAGSTNTFDFPTVAPLQATLKSAISNAFVAKIAPATPAGPQMYPTALNFANASVGFASQPQTVSLAAGSAAVTITGIAVSGPNAADFGVFSTCGATVPPTVVCTFTVTYTASGATQESATVTVTEGTGTQVFTLSGKATGSTQPTGTITFVATPLTFGSQEVGTVDPNAQGVSITVTGTNPVTLQFTSASGANPGDFTPGGQITAPTCNFGIPLNPGTTCSVPFQFAPTGAGARTAAVEIFGTFVNSPASVNASGTGVAQVASLTPPFIQFPGTVINTSSTAMIATLKNVSTSATLTNINPTISGPFSISANTCPVGGGLGPGLSCTFSIIFSPVTASFAFGELTVTDSDPPVQSIEIFGTGLNPAATLAPISPTFIAFGRQTAGTTTQAQGVFLQNTGNTNLVFTTPLTGTNPNAFGVTNGCGGTIPAGGTCSLSVTFTPPTGPGPFFATLTVQSTATGAPQTVTLTGTGVPPSTVSLLPNPLIFPASAVGQASPTEFAFLNNTGANLDVISNLSIGGTDPQDFQFTFSGPGNTPCFSGTVLNAQAVCVIGIIFIPDQLGLRTATLTVTDTATGTNHTIPLQGGTGTVPPVLSITKSHTGNFTQGQQGAPYTVTVSNAAGAGASSGLVTVTETAPAGLTVATMTGAGWTCTANTCTTTTPLQPGTSFPVITVAVNVAANATSPQVNAVSVSGGGSATSNATDSTVITAAGVPLTVATAGTGTGTVTGNGITCSSGSTAGCTVNLTAGTQVTLTETPTQANGSTFAGWSAPCNGSTATTCAFAMPATPLTVTATFNPGTTTVQLSVSTGGTGSGTVSGAGINCVSGSTAGCTTNVTPGTQVSLTEVPNSGSAFGGWSTICPSSTSATCTFTMPATAQVVGATFTLNPATLTSIAVTPANPTEPISSNLQFTATGTFSDNSTKDITSTVAWASSNTDAATINEGGLATTGSTANLTTTISATQGQVTGSTLLTVSNSPIILTVTPPPGGNPPQVPPGGRFGIGIVVTAIPPFTGTVTFGCTTSSPTITCQPDPSSVTFTSSGPDQVAFVVNTFCTGPTSTSVPGSGGSGFGGGFGLLILSLTLAGLAWTYRKSRRWALSFAVLMLFAIGGAACSSLPKGPNGATPPGDYTVTITATVNGTTVSTPPVPFVVE